MITLRMALLNHGGAKGLFLSRGNYSMRILIAGSLSIADLVNVMMPGPLNHRSKIQESEA
jgi:hypothetical protein